MPLAPKEVFDDLTDVTFAQWKHHPVSAAFFRFMEDQRQNWKDGAMDRWENGLLDPADKREDFNSNVVRGKVLALAEVGQISLRAIQEFYRAASEASQD